MLAKLSLGSLNSTQRCVIVNRTHLTKGVVFITALTPDATCSVRSGRNDRDLVTSSTVFSGGAGWRGRTQRVNIPVGGSIENMVTSIEPTAGLISVEVYSPDLDLWAFVKG